MTMDFGSYEGPEIPMYADNLALLEYTKSIDIHPGVQKYISW